MRPTVVISHLTPRRRHRGTSLFEVLIALLLITVGLLGVASSMTYAFMSNRGGAHSRVASEQAQAYLEKAARTPFANLARGTEFPATFTPASLPNGQGSITFANYPSSSSTNSKKITVIVSWQGGTADNGSVALSAVRTTD